MKSRKDRSRRGSRETLARNLRAGTGSLILAATVLATPRAEAAVPGPDASLERRAQEIRSQLAAELPSNELRDGDTRLAWWGNWHNWGYHPYWHNWPNWRNWHNWHNWGNF